ncbi:hypothetical protein FOA52_009690 [Chlamydomonas sp. UWO 241]|nr:hypothetical protein FOA52_009690 [Chlamydomonas sp. UWO 241]
MIKSFVQTQVQNLVAEQADDLRDDLREEMGDNDALDSIGNLFKEKVRPATQAPPPPPGFVLAPDEKDIWNGIFKPGQHAEFKNSADNMKRTTCWDCNCCSLACCYDLLCGCRCCSWCACNNSVHVDEGSNIAGLFHEVTLTNKRLLISERTVKTTSINKLDKDGYCWPWCWTAFPCCKGDSATTQSSSSLEKQVDDYVWLPDIVDVQFMRFKSKKDSTTVTVGTAGCMGCGDETNTHTSSYEELQFEMKLCLVKPVGVTKASWKQWKLDSELKTYHAEMVISGALSWERATELERLLLEIVSRNNAAIMAAAAAAPQK